MADDLPRKTEAPPIGALLRERVQELLRTDTGDRLEGLHPAIMREVERALLETVLQHTGGKREAASRILGLHRNSLRLRLRALGLEAPPEKTSRARRGRRS